jgi:hypothetical protein
MFFTPAFCLMEVACRSVKVPVVVSTFIFFLTHMIRIWPLVRI